MSLSGQPPSIHCSSELIIRQFFFFFHKFIESFNYFETQIYGQVLLQLHKRIRTLESRVAEKRALLRTVGYFNCLRFRPCIPSCVRTAFYKCFGDMDDSNSQTFASGYFSSSYSQIITRILRASTSSPGINNCFTHRKSAGTLL